MAEEYIKYIRDLEGVSRPVRDAELAEEVANIDTDIGDKIDEINKLIDSINSQIASINTQLSTVNSDISSLQSSVSSINTSITSINSDLTSVKTGGAVQRVGTSNVGSATKPIYLDGGTPKASDADVGSRYIPMRLNGGTFTACGGDHIISILSYECESSFLEFEGEEDFTVSFNAVDGASAYLVIPYGLGYGKVKNISVDADAHTVTFSVMNDTAVSTKHTVGIRYYVIAYARG